MTTAPPVSRVTEIPVPFLSFAGVVTAVEYPADRPLVVDLVLAGNLRTAETRTALYAQRHDGVWDLARHILSTAQLVICHEVDKMTTDEIEAEYLDGDQRDEFRLGVLSAELHSRHAGGVR